MRIIEQGADAATQAGLVLRRFGKENFYLELPLTSGIGNDQQNLMELGRYEARRPATFYIGDFRYQDILLAIDRIVDLRPEPLSNGRKTYYLPEEMAALFASSAT